MFSCTASWSTPSRRLPFLRSRRCRRPSGVYPSAWMRTCPPGPALAAGAGVGRRMVRTGPSGCPARAGAGRSWSASSSRASSTASTASDSRSSSAAASMGSSSSSASSASGSSPSSASASTSSGSSSAPSSASAAGASSSSSTSSSSASPGSSASASGSSPASESSPSSTSASSGSARRRRRRRRGAAGAASSMAARMASAGSLCPARRSRSTLARTLAICPSVIVASSSDTGIPMCRRSAIKASASTFRSSASSYTCICSSNLHCVAAALVGRAPQLGLESLRERGVGDRDSRKLRETDRRTQSVTIPQDGPGDRSVVQRRPNFVQLDARCVPCHQYQQGPALPDRPAHRLRSRSDRAGPSGQAQETERLTRPRLRRLHRLRRTRPTLRRRHPTHRRTPRAPRRLPPPTRPEPRPPPRPPPRGTRLPPPSARR